MVLFFGMFLQSAPIFEDFTLTDGWYDFRMEYLYKPAGITTP